MLFSSQQTEVNKMTNFNHNEIAKSILNAAGSEINEQALIDAEVRRYYEGSSGFNLECVAADIKDGSVSDSHYKNAIAKYRNRLKRAVEKVNEEQTASLKEKDGNFIFLVKDKKQSSDIEKELQAAFNGFKKLPDSEHATSLMGAMLAYAEQLAEKLGREHEEQQKEIIAEKAALAEGLEALRETLDRAA